MTIRGPQALASLDDALRDIRREEDEISKRLARASDRLTKVRESEAELFRKLAELRLDPAVRAELDGQIGASEQRARDMLKAHADLLGKTEADLMAADAEIARLTAVRTEVTTQIETEQQKLKALAARIGQEIARDNSYAQKRAEAEQLREVAEESVRKTETAEADRQTKGQPYRDDPLFMYLHERNFGTSQYKASNLVRYLDGLVAGLVGYMKARPNYMMLNEIPQRLREHADHQAKLAEAAEAEVDAIETAAIDAAGGKPVRDAIAAAQARITQIDADMVAAEDRRDELTKTRGGLATGQDPAFTQALSELATALGREDLQKLLADARRTSTGQDDTIVGQIDEARVRAREEDEEIREQTARLKTLEARRRELEDIQYEFKRSRFDDPRSSFREDKLVGDMLNDFLRGSITAASYWDHWRRSQNWSAGTGDWGGRVGLPDNGRARPSNSGSPWPQAGGSRVDWPDTSFGGGGSGGGGGSRPRARPGGFGGGWGGPPRPPSGGGGFSRPRTGSSGTRSHGGFKTGGKF
jgi:hypothetical protein